MVRAIFIGIGVILAAFAGWMIWGGPSDRVQKMPMVDTRMHGADAGAPAPDADDIVMPEQLSSPAQMGQIAFQENCASCHGKKASGTDKGPPLIHKIYEPSHHADFAFQRAAQQGVRAHHWRFGDMPPVDGVTDKQVEWITRYIREVQRANGIN